MATSKQMHILATRPSAHMKFLATGQLPQGVRPQGPLIDLLTAISPRDRAAIRGVKIDETLGYQGSRMFHTAEQALRWVRPDAEVFGSFPADSWRIKRASRPLHIEDLLEKASGSPEGLADRYPRLKRPVSPGHTQANIPVDQVSTQTESAPDEEAVRVSRSPRP